ncbi:PucR C-terminal helix-turn-helix domain-containing protein [Amycolatopsis arida]|uniref:PucR C-terminal helix-turn-helix domain-containing protein n=1 Tax=Amycolatopsis arida TaxID=587909 RepID=A0A1I5WRK9_9PSEU|nr:helix-turn-helix domain-containing protein [Amycolatopsis arida]TDX92407.1 PucR-like helix-turn-helix protein [Amycolatopsis arida]SFQ22221.1 PucR C-terminal helix-turn-helix domain-containing protein [Amycolatopsis arida]
MVSDDSVFRAPSDAALRDAYEELTRTLKRISAGAAAGGAGGLETRLLLARLPTKLAPILRTECGRVAREILHDIQRNIPEYARPIEGAFGKAIVAGVERGILEFVERLADPAARRRHGSAELFRKLGEYEVAEGRDIHVLQSAYRIGVRAGWQRLSEFGQKMKLPLPTMCLLADALFAYTDELSTLSVQGYTAARARAAGALERRRKRLLELVLADPPVAARAIADQATAAGWPLPERIAVVVLARADDDGAPPAEPVTELDPDVLVDLESQAPCLVVPVHGETVRDLAAGLAGWRAAVGPPVPLSRARGSLRWARRLLALARRGVLADAPVLSCVDHLTTLTLLDDPALAEQLVEVVLAPLLGVPERSRERMAETLSAWLETRGGAPEVAERLRIHPQTVRYRMRRIGELFGDRLTDADERFALMVALRGRRLLALGEPG